MGAFLAHPAVQSLPARDGDARARTVTAPTRAEMQKLRDLHARWT